MKQIPYIIKDGIQYNLGEDITSVQKNLDTLVDALNDIEVPSKLSELENDSNFITEEKVAEEYLSKGVKVLNTNGYDYVDLGLPSELLWATCNIGAKTPYEYGKYFQWADVVGYTGDAVVEHSYWSNTPYYSGSSNTDYSRVDYPPNLILRDYDDAAHVNLGGAWRMPTKEECQELIDNTTIQWVSGVGFKLISNVNQNYLIMPYAGNASNGVMYDLYQVSSLWSSTLNATQQYQAFQLRLAANINQVNSINRSTNKPIRGVIDKENLYSYKSQIPTKISELENDSDFISKKELTANSVEIEQFSVSQTGLTIYRDLYNVGDTITHSIEPTSASDPYRNTSKIIISPNTKIYAKACGSHSQFFTFLVINNEGKVLYKVISEQEAVEHTFQYDEEVTLYINNYTATCELVIGEVVSKYTIPTKLSELENDPNFATKQYVDDIIGDINSILETL